MLVIIEHITCRSYAHLLDLSYIATSGRKHISSSLPLRVISSSQQNRQTYRSSHVGEAKGTMIEVQAFDSGKGHCTTANNENDDRADYMSIISAHVSSLTPSLRRLSLTIHDNPEVRNKEFIAHEALTQFIREQEAKGQKWEVTPSAYGIETAFVAVWNSGREGAVVSFNAEYGEFLLD